MSEYELPPTPKAEQARDILDKVGKLATLSREKYVGQDFDGNVRNLFAETYTDLFPPPEVEPVIDADSMRELATKSYLSDNSSGIRDAVSGLKVPGTDIPMFLHGGSYSLFSTDGELYDFIEEREGVVYGTEEKPHNAAPYTVSKPLALFMLRALGRELDISNQSNSDLIADSLGTLPGAFHLGGIPVNIPTQDSETRDMVMGISSVELTPEALMHLLDTLKKSGAEHSIDPYMEGHFTGAGFLDELAGKTAESYLNGKKGDELQEIANAQWARLMAVAIPGPLPGQYC